MLFVEYPKCTTCQKARKWLESHGAAFTTRHIKDEVPTAEELKEWRARSDLPLKKFFNTSGLKYRRPQYSFIQGHIFESKRFTFNILNRVGAVTLLLSARSTP